MKKVVGWIIILVSILVIVYAFNSLVKAVSIYGTINWARMTIFFLPLLFIIFASWKYLIIEKVHK